MITYGVNENKMTYSKPPVNQTAVRVNELKKQREAKIRYIEDIKKILARNEEELRSIEKEFYLLANMELKKEFKPNGEEMSKKEMIIQYYKMNFNYDTIAEAVNVSTNYVSKVVSEYRKQNGLEKVKRGQETKQRIIQCLSSGMSLNQTAAAVNVTPQYVCMVKKEFESNL